MKFKIFSNDLSRQYLASGQNSSHTGIGLDDHSFSQKRAVSWEQLRQVLCTCFG